MGFSLSLDRLVETETPILVPSLDLQKVFQLNPTIGGLRGINHTPYYVSACMTTLSTFILRRSREG